MKVIIAGARDFVKSIPDTVDDISRAVEASGFEVTEVVEGGAWGVDSAARVWVQERGLEHTSFPVPDWVWDHLGPKAGPIRNGYMARYAEALIALPGGRGTRNMVKQAREHGLPVYLHGWTE